MLATSAEARRYTRLRHGIPESAIVIIETGKLIPLKGQDILLEAAIPVLRSRSNVWLIFIGAGDPTYTRGLQEKADREGIASRLLVCINLRLWSRIYAVDFGS